jgi:hypothetical protein
VTDGADSFVEPSFAHLCPAAMTDEAATRVDPSILHAIQTDRMNN